MLDVVIKHKYKPKINVEVEKRVAGCDAGTVQMKLEGNRKPGS